MAPNAVDGVGSLYKEIIVEHARRPCNKGRPACCRYCQEGKNPLCGDNLTVFCTVNAGSDTSEPPRISVGFDGSGCSISQASASMMCQACNNLTVDQIRSVITRAEGIYTGKAQPADPDDVSEDIEALAGVSKFPVRVKCAALAWKSLEILLNEHFDKEGRVKENDIGCDIPACATARRLKIISTESN
jgi:nitrogen fixation NifU-like protein